VSVKPDSFVLSSGNNEVDDPRSFVMTVKEIVGAAESSATADAEQENLSDNSGDIRHSPGKCRLQDRTNDNAGHSWLSNLR